MNHLNAEILRCVQKRAPDGVCRGNLTAVKNGLRCSICEHTYTVVDEVPILKPAGWETRERWYAEANANYREFYSHRSRTTDLKTNYLSVERETMIRLAQEHRFAGPCLEVGCGTGIFAECVPGFIGVDYSMEVLCAEGFSGHARLCGDARWLPFPDGAMNCVYSFNTLEHVPEVERAFAEMDRVLAPGGLLVLKPAWHSARYVTELIEVRSYRELGLRGKLTKMLLPIIKSKPAKFLHRIPWRIWRRATASSPTRLRWRPLHPNPKELWRGGDVDAVASLDSHEAILYYQSRGYKCLSHTGALRSMLAGHDLLVMRKLRQVEASREP